MDRSELQKYIVGCFYSEALRKKINGTGFVFEDTELVKVIYYCAENHDECIRLLEAASHCLAAEAAALAVRTVEKMRRAERLFLENTSDTVYELCINDKPGAYTEKYLCTSFASALKQLDWFAEYYADVDAVIDGDSYIEINKRRVFAEDDERGEDYIGRAVIDCGKNVLEYDIQGFSVRGADDETVCDKYESCSDCEEMLLCHSPKYPQFLKDGDIVRYVHSFSNKGGANVKYGLTLYNHDDEMLSEFYVILLDNERFKRGDFEKCWEAHTHVSAPDAEKAEYSELPDELKRVYDGLMAYMKEQGMLKNGVR